MAEARYRVRSYNQLSSAQLARLPEDRYVLAPETAEPHAILVRSADLHGQDLGSALLAVGRAGVDTMNIPVSQLTRRGVVVFNAPGANAQAVMELAIGCMILAARNLPQGIDFARRLAGSDAEISRLIDAGKPRYTGSELAGATLGIVGLGAIGARLAVAAQALGMRVLGVDSDPAAGADLPIERCETLDALLGAADFISLHLPLTPRSKGLIDAAALAQLRSGATLINLARAGLVDETALAAALDQNRLASYVTDFPSLALRGHPSVIALPRLGASTWQAAERCTAAVVDRLRDFLDDGNILDSVNFPSLSLARTAGKARLAVASLNVATITAELCATLAAAGLNIHEMARRSRGDVAYTLIDLDSAPDEQVMARLQAASGMLRLRLLTAG